MLQSLYWILKEHLRLGKILQYYKSEQSIQSHLVITDILYVSISEGF